ncbi:hypothetical protein ALNOE001_14890 [Candidatus Methanobinarius endosymbioticus]|uniref:Uncharacterized protein n=1 Tax=Candidatus Methanobinarius endosymbioticus TaxID=2006182 RepID=A0A366M9B9_9EURY|nr:hypothetical protein ALNOE001_14890 [Candidatus Methanobinarius endosymbioticus]
MTIFCQNCNIFLLNQLCLRTHDVTLYTYNELDNVPEGVKIKDGNTILDKNSVFKYRDGYAKGSYSGFAD